MLTIKQICNLQNCRWLIQVHENDFRFQTPEAAQKHQVHGWTTVLLPNYDTSFSIYGYVTETERVGVLRLFHTVWTTGDFETDCKDCPSIHHTKEASEMEKHPLLFTVCGRPLWSCYQVRASDSPHKHANVWDVAGRWLTYMQSIRRFTAVRLSMLYRVMQ